MLESALEGPFLRVGSGVDVNAAPEPSSASPSDQVTSDHAEPAGTLAKRPVRTSRQISTSAGAGQAPVYRELAAAAHAAGHTDVSPTQIHEWVMDGLVPPTSRQVSVGRRGFTSVREPGVEEQLLALCHLRRETKSWDRLAILLWLDGWPVAADRLKSALLAELPVAPEKRRWTEKELDQLGVIADRRGPSLAQRLGIGRIGRRVAADGLYLLVSIALGTVRGVDEDAARTIERVAGMDPRARTDTIDGVGPWLTGSAAAGLDGFARAFSISRVQDLVEEATDADLAAARERARFLARDFPVMVRVLELTRGRNFAGLRLVGRLVSRMPHLAVAMALYAEGARLADGLDELARTAAECGPSRRTGGSDIVPT